MIADNEINKIAQSALMIVGGYAFCLMDGGNIKVVGINAPNHVSVIRPNGEVLETNMDDIELDIISEYWQRNKIIVEEEMYA